MKSSFYFALIALAVVGLRSPAESPAKRVLILDDGSLIEGTVEAFDGVFRVTPANGTAKLITPKQIAFAGETRAAAYDFAAGKVDATTAEGARQLADWCEKVGMHDRALLHARTVAAKAPDDATARAAVARLEKTIASKPAVPMPGTANVPMAAPVQVELASGASAAFASKIQPILTNQCANCHAAKDYAGPFALSRIAPGYANPEAVAANLKATIGQLRRESPERSPFLSYGLVAHGGQKRPAFANREMAAFQNLEAWVLAYLPKAQARAGFAIASVPPKDKAEPAATALPGAVVGALGQPVKPAPAPTVPPVAVVAPAPVRNSADPFDPQMFNRLPKTTKKDVP